MAHYGDIIGRKRVFTLSIFNGCTYFGDWLITYLCQHRCGCTVITLLLMRIMQGAAIGGEMPGAWVFIAEHTPKQRYGLRGGYLNIRYYWWHLIRLYRRYYCTTQL